MVGFTFGSPTIDITLHHRDDRDTLTERISVERNAKARDRCRCVLLAIDGLTAPQIAERVGRSRRFAQRWCYAYRDGGLDALTPKRQTGRPPRLAPDRHEAFKARMLAGPTEADGVCTLRGEDARRILEAEFGVAYSLNGVYDLMHRLGLSCLKPRPQHRKADVEAQQRWLERAPLLFETCDSDTPTSASRSGSRTKPASANKGD